MPGPRGLPFVGNVLDMKDEEATLQAHKSLDILQVLTKGFFLGFWPAKSRGHA